MGHSISAILFFLFFAADFMHEISNDGAKKQFDIYLTKTILPVLAECAQVSFNPLMLDLLFAEQAHLIGGCYSLL